MNLNGSIPAKLHEVIDHIEKFPFAPRGSTIDPFAPDLNFSIRRKVEVWADNLEELYEKAKAEQWNASHINWNSLPTLPDEIEKAVSQLMTFLAENEYIALYLPAKFLPRISPYFNEVVLFLASQIVDEARHVEVFSKRAAIRSGPQHVSAATQYALKSLLEMEDYAKAKFLLNILGEGSFEDLFTFILEVAPDPVTREIISLAKRDEARHIAYGVMRTKRQLENDPHMKKQLVQAIEERASYLYAVSGADQHVIDALATLAGGGSERRQMEKGLKKISELHQRMHQTRIRRLLQAGFDRDTAIRISELHSSAVKSFM
jgi:CII-binding regulator of phage lambda lysogenization HflD